MNNRLPVGNLLVCGAILFSGCSVTEFLKVFTRLNISCFSERTYQYIQAFYLIPSVTSVWRSSQETGLREVADHDVKLGVDARCCSPGHTANYASYSLMDLETGLILDLQLIQVQV